MIELLISFVFLLFLEIVLGIDNIIFISLIADKLPKELQKRVRFIGLSLSLVFRLILLFFIGYLLRFSEPIFSIFEISISFKDIIMILGGLFLLAKGTSAMHEEVTHSPIVDKKSVSKGMFNAIVQIIIIDFVFSLDSLITAIGISEHLFVIASAIIISIVFMLIFSGIVSKFIAKYPTLKVLALSFILMVGLFLILEGLSIHVNKGYIYFAMGFSLAVEIINILIKRKNNQVELSE